MTKRNKYSFNGDIRSRSYEEWQETLEAASSQEIRFILAKFQGRDAGWIKISRRQKGKFGGFRPPKELEAMQAILIERLIQRLEELENNHIQNGLSTNPARRREAQNVQNSKRWWVESDQKKSSLSQYKSDSKPDRRPKVKASEKLHNQRAKHVS
tara:strand:+ start:62 stop:526 length:465 start_codon:yes stop_codon:yes gene_type:complete